jgi:hypothetical protein
MCVEKYLYCIHCLKIKPLPLWDRKAQDVMVVGDYYCKDSFCARFNRLSYKGLKTHPFFMVNEYPCGGPSCSHTNCRVDRIFYDCSQLQTPPVRKFDYEPPAEGNT